MGFPYSEATWDVVDGAMFMGWGGSMPAIWTIVSVVICIVLLWIGNKHEHDLYASYK